MIKSYVFTGFGKLYLPIHSIHIYCSIMERFFGSNTQAAIIRSTDYNFNLRGLSSKLTFTKDDNVKLFLQSLTSPEARLNYM